MRRLARLVLWTIGIAFALVVLFEGYFFAMTGWYRSEERV